MALLGMLWILQKLLSLLFTKGPLGLLRITTHSKVFISRGYNFLFLFFFSFICEEILEMRSDYMYLYRAVVYVHHCVYSSFAQNHSVAPGTEPDIWLFLLIHLHKKKNQPLQCISLLRKIVIIVISRTKFWLY